MIWTLVPSSEFPGVRNFALKRKLALIAAHDSILVARTKQVRDANRKRRKVPFSKDDLVYLSTKNISFAKGLAQKLIPKFVGPYKITEDFGNQSFHLPLPMTMISCGVHGVFHASLLRVHIPNNDHLFLGRLDEQVGHPEDVKPEWAVDKIVSHVGQGSDSVFQLQWRSGDITWLPYDQAEHLNAMTAYLDLQGVSKIEDLPIGTGKMPEVDQKQANLLVGCIKICQCPRYKRREGAN
ncbi:hypothetical protein J132_05718 [Termitomyces sp. J132]|nr:hypothetical protein J132_05718 [Termitomyces sp. J132]